MDDGLKKGAYKCKRCGWPHSGKYCPKCGTEYADDEVSDESEVTLSFFETDEDRMAVARRALWDAVHEENFDGDKCPRLAKELESFSPEDYLVNFVQIVCAGNEKDIISFLDKSRDGDAGMYADVVLDYLSRHMSVAMYRAVTDFKSRFFLGLLTKYDEEIEKYVPEKIRKRREKDEWKRLRRGIAERAAEIKPKQYVKCLGACTMKEILSCASVCLFWTMFVILFTGFLYISKRHAITVYAVCASVAALMTAVSLGYFVNRIVRIWVHGPGDTKNSYGLKKPYAAVGVIGCCVVCSFAFLISDIVGGFGKFPFVAYLIYFFVSLATLIYGVFLTSYVGECQNLFSVINRDDELFEENYFSYRKLVHQSRSFAFYRERETSGRPLSVSRRISRSRAVCVFTFAIVIVVVIMFFVIRSACSLFHMERLVGGFYREFASDYAWELLNCDLEDYTEILGTPDKVTDGAMYWFDETDKGTCNFIMVTFEDRDGDDDITSIFFDKNHVYDESDDMSTVSKEAKKTMIAGDSFELRCYEIKSGYAEKNLSGEGSYAVEYKDGSLYATSLKSCAVADVAVSSCVVEWSDELGSYSADVPLSYNVYVDKDGFLTRYFSSDGIVDITFDVTGLSEDALDSMTYIKAIILPENVKSITIPESVEKIEDGAFENCSFLECVTLNGGTTYERMFDDCLSLTEIVIGNGVMEIAEYAFYGLTELKCVTIGEGVGSMGKYAFYGCTSMEELYFNAVVMDDLNSHNCVFYDAGRYSGGMTLTVGAKVANIPACLFCSYRVMGYSRHSPYIISIVFKQNSICASIGEYAFDCCMSLTSVLIPVSITSIGCCAFSSCISLSCVYYFGSYEEWEKIGISSYNTNLSNATRYYYSETSPTSDGNFWHFEDGTIRVW